MKNSLKLTGLAGMLALIMACTHNKVSSDVSVIIQADKDFSALSIKSGMKKAFTSYADSLTVLLRPGKYPIESKLAMMEAQKTVNDSLFTLSWTPLKGTISASGDLGFTYGIYILTPKDTAAAKVEKGTYVTIWKKQSDGSWKFCLDAGNEGLDK